MMSDESMDAIETPMDYDNPVIEDDESEPLDDDLGVYETPRNWEENEKFARFERNYRARRIRELTLIPLAPVKKHRRHRSERSAERI